eukprot:6468076-Amphidinium_carterae.1
MRRVSLEPPEAMGVYKATSHASRHICFSPASTGSTRMRWTSDIGCARQLAPMPRSGQPSDSHVHWATIKFWNWSNFRVCQYRCLRLPLSGGRACCNTCG